MKDQHVAIAGAGIIGLSAALAFAEAGARVTVFERGRAMEQASWAAGGMLAVHDPENDPRLLPLSQLSRSLYPAFLQRIEALSGLAVPLRTQRTLQEVAHGGPAAYLDQLSSDWHFQELEEASLDPHDLCAALPAAVRAAGVTLYEHTPVRRVLLAENGRGVRVEVCRGTDDFAADQPPAAAQPGEVLHADHFVLAAGAWSGQLHCGVESMPPVAPRKGQMLEVRLAESAPPLPIVVRTHGLYLIPRGDGRVVIGATVEDAGFDRRLDPAAAEELLHKAAALWPPILNSIVTAHWSGLRPGYSDPEDTLPLIAPLEQQAHRAPRLWAATGHFRNGILLAPGTAQLLLAMLEDREPSVPVEDFSAARFAVKQALGA